MAKRKAFEKWAIDSGLSTFRHPTFTGDYFYKETQFSWLAWIAATKSTETKQRG